MQSREESVVASYLEAGEELWAAFSSYTGGGFGRRVVGVSSRRLLMVRSGYWGVVSDRGLLWADPLDAVALDDRVTTYYTNGVYTGNALVTVRRADGRRVRLNPRGGFFGGRHAAEDNIATLYSLIRGRIQR